MKYKTKQQIACGVVVVLLFIVAPICVESALWITLAALAVSGVLIRSFGLGDYHEV